MTNDQPPAYSPAQPLSPSDERMWATLIHVGGIIIGFISPLLGYLLLKDRSAFVGANAKNALNFQLTWTAIQVANLILGSVLTVVTLGLWGILQILIAVAGGVIVVIFSILGAVAANRGEVYRYPLTIPFIR